MTSATVSAGVMVAMAAAGCGGGRGDVAAPRNGAGDPVAFPEACRVKPGEGADAPWHWRRSGDCVAARAADGGLVVLEHRTLVRRGADGEVRWEVDVRDADGRMCGYPDGLAIAADGSVALGCGYSLLVFGPDGRRRWQVWPGGNVSVGAPVVDGGGRVYVVAGGILHAVGADGKTIWRAGMGGRSASAIGVTPEGNFVIDTTEDVWIDGDTVYHPDPDPTIFVIDRDGKVVEERRHNGSGPWPATVPITDEAGGRLP